MWQCDWECLNTHIMMNIFFGFFFFCINVKNKYGKRILDHFFFDKKIYQNCKKIKIMLQTFPYWFGLVTNF
jgi:hypothetical protein